MLCNVADHLQKHKKACRAHTLFALFFFSIAHFKYLPNYDSRIERTRAYSPDSYGFSIKCKQKKEKKSAFLVMIVHFLFSLHHRQTCKLNMEFNRYEGAHKYFPLNCPLVLILRKVHIHASKIADWRTTNLFSFLPAHKWLSLWKLYFIWWCLFWNADFFFMHALMLRACPQPLRLITN